MGLGVYHLIVTVERLTIIADSGGVCTYYSIFIYHWCYNDRVRFDDNKKKSKNRLTVGIRVIAVAIVYAILRLFDFPVKQLISQLIEANFDATIVSMIMMTECASLWLVRTRLAVGDLCVSVIRLGTRDR